MAFILPVAVALVVLAVWRLTTSTPVPTRDGPRTLSTSSRDGVIVCIDRERPTPGGNVWLELTVRVPRPSMPTYLAVGEIEVSAAHHVRPGDRVELEVDPENPVRIRVTATHPSRPVDDPRAG